MSTSPPGATLVVGGGIAGLTCARVLAEAGHRVTLVDKGRRPGGRLTTRVSGSGPTFDQGAQFLTARSLTFQRQVRAWCDAGWATRWDGRFVDLTPGQTLTDTVRQAKRYVGLPGMGSLVEKLSEALDGIDGPHFERRIARLQHTDEGWRAVDTDDQILGPFDRVVVAVPPPQARPLLGPHDADLDDHLATVQSRPTWTVMLAFEDSIELPDPFASAFVSESPLSSITHNSAKPGRPDPAKTGDCWVLHATTDWSQTHVDDENAAVVAALTAAMEQALGQSLPTPTYAACAPLVDGPHRRSAGRAVARQRRRPALVLRRRLHPGQPREHRTRLAERPGSGRTPRRAGDLKSPEPSPSAGEKGASSPAKMSAPLPRLYTDLAWLWPLLSPPEQYLAEAELLEELIARRLGPGPHRILELGAGGGHTLVHLDQRGAGRHDCVAVDLAEPMLAHARRLIPGLPTHVADMRDLRLDQTFDVVLIHDAVDYLLTPDDVTAALVTAHAHLRPGGLALIAPTYTHETFIDGETAQDTAVTDLAPPLSDENTPDPPPDEAVTTDAASFDGEVTYLSYVHDPDPADHTFEMILVYLVRPAAYTQPARAVQLIEDRHTCGLFDRADWLAMLAAVQLEAEFVQQGDDDEAGAWSLFVGTRPPSPPSLIPQSE